MFSSLSAWLPGATAARGPGPARERIATAANLGRGHLTVVPLLPPGQDRIAAAAIPLGGGSVDVAATRRSKVLTTTVALVPARRLTIGAVPPAGASVVDVRLDGQPVHYRLARTPRGVEVRADAGTVRGRHTLAVRLS